MPEMTQQVPQIPSAFATTPSTPMAGTGTDPATVAPFAPVAPAAATPAAQSGGGVMSAMMSLYHGLFDAPQATGPQEDKDLPVAVGDGMNDSYDAYSSPAPGVDAPESPVSDNLGWLSSWWPTLRAGYEMVSKGPEKADAATVGEGVTTPLKNFVTTTADATIAPGVGSMIGQVMDGVQQTADLLVPNKGGVNGMVGDQVKETGKLLNVAGGEVLDTVASGVNTVGGGAVGAIDSVVGAAQHSLGIDDGTPLDLPTELDPIEERMDTEWAPAPIAPTGPAEPMESVVLPPLDANPLSL